MAIENTFPAQALTIFDSFLSSLEAFSDFLHPLLFKLLFILLFLIYISLMRKKKIPGTMYVYKHAYLYIDEGESCEEEGNNQL